MFFPDPAVAFANIAGALRPGGRMVLLVWQRREHNAWARAIDAALGDAAQPPQPGMDPFSLGDAEATAGILESAGFDGMRFADVHEAGLLRGRRRRRARGRPGVSKHERRPCKPGRR